jgi:Tol biopolymer transport system component
MRVIQSILPVALAAVMLESGAAQASGPVIIATLPQIDHLTSPAAGASMSLSADGRYVAFVSRAQLVEADTNISADVYVLNTVTGDVTLETLTPDGRVASGDSHQPWLDGTGRYLVFTSGATNLIEPALPPKPLWRVFLRDRVERTTRLLSVDRRGRPANGDSSEPMISVDGRSVAFTSSATTLVAGVDKNGKRPDVYLLRLATGAIERVSVTSAGEQLSSGMSFMPSVSADGRFVAFSSTADLTCQAGDGCAGGRSDGAGPSTERNDVYVHDTRTGQTRRVTRTVNGDEPNGASFHPSISADGRFVAFASEASNLVAKDRNRTTDVFVVDLHKGTIELASRNARGRPGSGRSNRPVISGDGTLVAFQSDAADLVCASRCERHERDINMVSDVFLHDRRRGTTVRLSADGSDEWMDPSGGPRLAAYGRLLAFTSRHPTAHSDIGADHHAYVVRLPAMERTTTSARSNRPR